MFHLHPGAWLIGREDPEEGRNRMHRIAIHEARIATEYREATAEEALMSPARSFAGLRLASSSGPSGDLAACCA
jgi:hypothetical protein